MSLSSIDNCLQNDIIKLGGNELFPTPKRVGLNLVTLTIIRHISDWGFKSQHSEIHHKITQISTRLTKGDILKLRINRIILSIKKLGLRLIGWV